MSFSLTATATLHLLVLPTNADAADAAEFREYANIRNNIAKELTGRDEEHQTPAELLASLQPTPESASPKWFIRQGSEIVGRAGIHVPLEDGAQYAYCGVELLPRLWGLGIGSAALAQMEAAARQHGRSILQSFAEHQASPGERLTPSTGFGSVPHDHAAKFCLRHGFTLEQVERVSTFVVADNDRARIAALLASASEAAADYRVVQWTLPTPPEYQAGYARMKSRMSTDAPSADMESAAEEWDAGRIVRHDTRYSERGATVQVTAAIHLGTGELCAFNELVLGVDPAGVTHQEDTLVLADHRGHRLGMLVKTAAILSWADIAPHSPQIITYNAEENRPMLVINEEIGFEPTSYIGAWKKVLG